MIFSRQSGRSSRPPRDVRLRMIAETEAFLNWALQDGRDLPRIPRRRVDAGGFEPLLRHPGARAMVLRWWQRALDVARQD